MPDVQMVELESVVGSGTTQPVKKEYKITVASKLLKSELKSKVKTWTLPKDSPYTQDTNGNLIKRGGSPIDKGAETPKGNTESPGQEDPA